MNTNNTIFPNIGNRNKTCNDFGNDDVSIMSSRISKLTSENTQQNGTSTILQERCFVTEYNGIHTNPQKRKVDLNGAETYLRQPERNGVFCHESIGNSTSNTKNILGSREWPSFTETVKNFFTSLVPQMKEGCKAFAWDPKPKVIAASLLNIYSPGLSFMGKGLTILYLLANRATVINAGSEVKTTGAPDKVEVNNEIANSKDLLSEGMSTNNTIDINDLEMLEKIGTNNDFPSDGNYELTANIDAMNFTKTMPEFRGDFNGNNHTISNLQVPLIVKMTNGIIRNLTISNANIHDRRDCLAVLVCFAGGNSTISHTQFENSQIQNDGDNDYSFAGMVTLEISDSAQIESVSVKNCTIDINILGVFSGFLAGMMLGTSTSNRNTVDNSSIITRADTSVNGALIGSMGEESLSSNDKVNNCHIETNGGHSETGGAVGEMEAATAIKNVRVSDSRVYANNQYSSAGIAVGRTADEPLSGHVTISDSTAINSRATVIHKSSSAGIWVGRGHGNINLHNNTYSNCTIVFPGSEKTPPASTTSTTSTISTTLMTEATSTAAATSTTATTLMTEATSTAAANSTTAANLTTTEPAMIVDGTLFLPLGVLLAGATVTSIGLTGCFVYSLYNGYKEGKRGRSLAAHPFVSAGRLLDGYKFCTGFQLVATEPVEHHVEEEMILMNEISYTV